MSMILGTDHLDNYWHRVLLGIIEIQVDTVVVNENDFGSRLSVPIICATILMIALICIFIICCYSQRKRRELLMRYATTTTIAPNNEPSSNLIQNLSDSNNHSMNVTNPINITSIHQNYPSYHPQFRCESTLQSKRFLSPQFHHNLNGRRVLAHNDNDNITSNIPKGICTVNTNHVNMNQYSGPVMI
uniref:Uncharacterized protein n=1 Tax=Schistosoma mansoni TaxID=6183 RepID=A0A5K4F913_SCHMA